MGVKTKICVILSCKRLAKNALQNKISLEELQIRKFPNGFNAKSKQKQEQEKQ